MGIKCIRVFADQKQIESCRHRVGSMSQAFTNLSKILALGGNEVRLKILFLLKDEGELCPCDISDILGMSIPAISQHLRKMKDGNILISRRTGQTIFYSLAEGQKKIIEPIISNIHHELINQK